MSDTAAQFLVWRRMRRSMPQPAAGGRKTTAFGREKSSAERTVFVHVLFRRSIKKGLDDVFTFR
jgi:hypothetical protein